MSSVRIGGFQGDSWDAGIPRGGAPQTGDQEKGPRGGTGTKIWDLGGAAMVARGTTAGVRRGSRPVPRVRIGTRGDRGTLGVQEHPRRLTRGGLPQRTSGESRNSAGVGLGTVWSGPLGDWMTGSGDLKEEETAMAWVAQGTGPQSGGIGLPL